MSEGLAVIGAFGTDDNGSNSGAVHFYSIEPKARIAHIDDQYVTDDMLSEPISITVLNDNSGMVHIAASASNLTFVDSVNLVFENSGSNSITTSTIANVPLCLSLTITPTPGLYTQFSTITLLITDASGLTHLSAFDYHRSFPEQKIFADDGIDGDQFGTSVSISQNHAIVGAMYNDERASNAGAAYIYSFSPSGWSQSAKLTAIDGDSSDYFGCSTAIDGDHAIIGA
ncbi:MAG: hypothetical protein OMM_14832, partial [Candidatus Magnetoglobus multicellularis str. Araruama]